MKLDLLGTTFTLSPIFLIGLTVFVILNFLAFLLMAVDKFRAGTGAQRFPEKLYFLLALVGGSPGIILGMKIWRHKTRKASFFTTIGIIIALQIAGIFFFLQNN
ncbi:MAG TPA: DUF1294 domain-containing protein [Candidatus Magasanikbacteria bacterium]|nr:DUF1294 domain-containing protein [Candidatus Magasanikbacteria bacterium]